MKLLNAWFTLDMKAMHSRECFPLAPTLTNVQVHTRHKVPHAFPRNSCYAIVVWTPALFCTWATIDLCQKICPLIQNIALEKQNKAMTNLKLIAFDTFVSILYRSAAEKTLTFTKVGWQQSRLATGCRLEDGVECSKHTGKKQVFASLIRANTL